MNTDAPKVKPNEFVYSLKTWLTAAALGPVLYIFHRHSIPDFEMLAYEFFTMLFYGLFFSVPSFALSYVIVKLVNRLKCSVVLKKCILVVAGILLTVVAGYLFDTFHHIFDLGMDRIVICYLISTTIAIWIYKLHPDN